MRTTFAITGLLTLASTVLAAGEGLISDKVSKFGNHSLETKEYIVTFDRNETAQFYDVKKYLEELELKEANDGDIIKWQSNNDDVRVIIMEICDTHAEYLKNTYPEVTVVEEKVSVQSFIEEKENAPW